MILCCKNGRDDSAVSPCSVEAEDRRVRARVGRSIDVGQFCVTDFLMLVILASLTVFIVWRRDYGTRFWLGMGIGAVGISLWALARIQLGSSFSVSPQARRLVTTGLYSKFRNPIYLFGGVGIVGLLVALGNWTMLAMFIALNSLQVPRTKKEAKTLEATFGASIAGIARTPGSNFHWPSTRLFC